MGCTSSAPAVVYDDVSPASPRYDPPTRHNSDLSIPDRDKVTSPRTVLAASDNECVTSTRSSIELDRQLRQDRVAAQHILKVLY